MAEAPSYRVSPQQEQLWALEPEGPQGRIQAVVGLEGTVDPAALRAALEQLVLRHEILRTTFVRHPGIRVPLQAINDSLPLRWQTIDLQHAEEAAQTQLAAAMAEEISRPLDFEQGPLVQALLADTGDTTHTLVLTLPSLHADHATVEVLLGELVAFLADGSVAGEPLQYADFSEWQHEQLSTGAGSAPKAADEPAPRIPLGRVGQADRDLDEVAVPANADIGASVAELAARYGSTPAVLTQAAWHAFISRVTGQDDVIVSTLNATPRHPDLEGAVGLIARPLPVTTSVPDELTYAELVDQVDRELAAVASNQDTSPPATVSARFGFVVRPSFEAAGNDVRFSLDRVVDSGQAAPLALAYEESVERQLRLALVFDRAVLDPEHAKMLALQFERLFRSALANPGAGIGTLELLGDDDRHLLLAGFNDTAATFADLRVHELFAQRAAETPEQIAVTDGHDSLSYAALDTRANQLAHALSESGVGAGDVVGLCTDRSVDMAVAVLGILKAGAAYLPLNHEHPPARLRHQLVESGARALVTQEALLDRLPEFEHKIVCLDRDRAQLDTLKPSAPEAAGSPDDLVYVIYTSGSTGTPKGVAVTHRNLSNYTNDLVQRLDARSQPLVFGMVTAISTDLGNTAFFPALCSGGMLALVRPEVAADPAAFANRVADSPLDVLKITPSHLNALLRANDARVLPQRWLVVGGERLGWDLIDRVRELSDCRILNHYGPTETTVGSCTMLVEDGPGPYAPATVPIGRPISNTRCYVLDDQLQPVPLDVPGRLFIGGAGVARGYIGQPELTAERFLVDPFGGEGQIYDTGDLARRLPDGTLEFLGRADEQVKIRGFRVEPSEVESALRRHPAVANAAVVPMEESAGDIRLVAYCELREPTTADDLRGHIAEWVPDYMIPSAFVMLDALPLTPSGKVDRLALPDIAAAGPREDGDYVAPRSAVEEAVAAIWADVLRLEQVSVNADFFAIGGHSLLATQVVAQVRTDFAIDLPLHSLFVSPTVALLSSEIVTLMGAADQVETAKLLDELEDLSDEESSSLVSELGRGDGAA